MTSPYVADIQVGWKVFAGPEQIGEVTQVADDTLEVTRGTLRRHHYRIPKKYVTEATDGVVDLRIDPAAVGEFDADRPATPDDPGGFERVEDLGDPVDPADQPPFGR